MERFYNVAVHSATEPNEPLVRNILLSVAENFSRQLSARMHDFMTGNAGEGFHNGGVAPYGYVAVKTPSGRTDRKGNPIMHVRFEVEPDQAPIVQRVFREYGDGLSMAQIAHRLNTDGITSPTKGTWDLGAVRYILFNEAYRGWRVWNKRGSAVCPNATYVHQDRLEGAVLDLLQRETLTKATVRALIEDVREAWNSQKDGTKEELERIERELRKVEREITNLVNAIKAGGISETIKNELERSEERKGRLERTRLELQQARPQTDRLPTPEEIAGALEGFRCLLESGTPQEKKAILEENIKRIVVKQTGDVTLEVNPAGLLPGDFSHLQNAGRGT